MLNQRRSIPQPEGPSEEPEPFSLIPLEADAYLAIPEVIQHPLKPKRQTWRWLLVAILSCFATSAAAVGAFLWLVNLPPVADCDNTAAITTERAELYCAQVSAQSGDLDDVLASLDVVGGWGTDHFLYHEVQPLVNRWAEVVLQSANQALRDGNLEEAQALMARIPTHSTVHEAGQASLSQWNEEWEAGAALMAKAEAALRQKDWGTASNQARALVELENPHWRVDQAQALSRRIRQEQQAQALLTDAVNRASLGGRDRLVSALRTVNQIDASTFAYETAQTYMDRWSDLLLDQGLADWYASDLDQAIALGQAVAINPRRNKEAQSLVWLSQSRKLARQSVGTWRTSPDQLITLYQAMLLANRVPTDSRFHPQAQSSVATWRTHLEGMGQLQMAQLAGRVNQREALKLAMAQAEKVPIGHPRRVQAQTLMAHWRQEIERIEDQPYLAKARELAQDSSLGGLRAAIAEANQIAMNRALRGEAQSWIYMWQSQVQTLEDQPILDRARDLARRGQLSQAIVEASGIQSRRALHGEAQAAIVSWRRQITAQEQARQRAAQRVMSQPQTANGSTSAEDPTTLTPATATPASSATRPSALSAPTPPAAPAPVAAPRPSSRSTPRLPAQIETVAGDEPTPTAPSEVLRPAAPRPITAEPPASAAPPAPPVPLAPAVPPAPPAPPAPVMTAPPPIVPAAPPVPAVPPAPPAPVTLPPASNSAPPPPESSPSDPGADLQSQRPAAVPVVSAHPLPELALRPHLAQPHLAQYADVLATGALYLYL